MEIVMFESENHKHEFHLSGSKVMAEFRISKKDGKRTEVESVREKRKVYKDDKGEFIALYSGTAFGNIRYKHYLNK